MTVEEINAFIAEEMGLAEEQGDNISIRLYLSDESSIEIWLDEEADLYTWSNASYGCEECQCAVSDMIGWIENNHLEVTDMEVV